MLIQWRSVVNTLRSRIAKGVALSILRGIIGVDRGFVLIVRTGAQ